MERPALLAGVGLVLSIVVAWQAVAGGAAVARYAFASALGRSGRDSRVTDRIRQP